MRKKLYRIGNSKEPTLDQLQRMTSNLRTSYNVYVTIQARVWAHEDGGRSTSYWFGMKDPYSSAELETWKEVLEKYRQLMKEAPK